MDRWTGDTLLGGLTYEQVWGVGTDRSPALVDASPAQTARATRRRSAPIARRSFRRTAAGASA